MGIARILYINLSPLIKRIFWWSPEISTLISISALLVCVRSRIDIQKAFIALILVMWVAITVSVEKAILMYFPVLFIWMFISHSLGCDAVQFFWKIRYVYLLTVIYAIFQKAYGYFPFELNWIQSGMGAVRAEGYFVTDSIRPFSVYAGISEFGLISVVMVYTGYCRRNLLLMLLGASGILLAGSRGIIVAMITSVIGLALSRALSPRLTVVIGFLGALLGYLLLSLVLPALGLIGQEADPSRLMVYGTFRYRVSMLLEFYNMLNITNIWLGVWSDKFIFDNFFLTILNDFGIVGLSLFFCFIIGSVKANRDAFFIIFLLTYSLYADALFSVYFMFNILVLINYKPHEFEVGNRYFSYIALQKKARLL